MDDIIETAMTRLKEKYSPKGMELELIKLENGYKRFDPQRGMEYMLDLKLKVTVESGSTEIRWSKIEKNISGLNMVLSHISYLHYTYIRLIFKDFRF